MHSGKGRRTNGLFSRLSLRPQATRKAASRAASKTDQQGHQARPHPTNQSANSTPVPSASHPCIRGPPPARWRRWLRRGRRWRCFPLDPEGLGLAAGGVVVRGDGEEADEITIPMGSGIRGAAHPCQISSRSICRPGKREPASRLVAASMRWGSPPPLAGHTSTACCSEISSQPSWAPLR